MASSFAKLDEALKDLITAFAEVQEEIEAKHSDDEDAYASALIDALETSVDSAVEEQDSSTGDFATILSSLSEALEQLDPSAFEEDTASDEFSMEEMDYDLLDEDEEEDEDLEDLDELEEDDDDDDDDDE